MTTNSILVKVSRNSVFLSGVFRVLMAVLLAMGAGERLGAQADTDQIDRDIVAEERSVPPNLMFRARVVGINPPEHMPTDIVWRYGGQGVSSGETETGKMGEAVELNQWTEKVPLDSIVKRKAPKLVYLNVLAGYRGKLVDRVKRTYEGGSKDIEMEFEFSDGDKVLKTIKARGPNGGTFTLVIPIYRLAGEASLDAPEFVEELDAVLGYADRRADFLEGLPWANGPLPKRFAVAADLRGYGEGVGFGIHHSDPEVLETEARSLRQLGVNGLRDPVELILGKMGKGEGCWADFRRVIIDVAGGFPVVRYRKGREAAPGAGCPFSSSVPSLTAEQIERAKNYLFNLPVPEVWAITVDEIGSVFDGTPEGKGHVASCPECAVAYRKYLREEEGLTPADFGESDWSEVSPVNVWVKEPDAERPWETDPAVAFNAGYTRRFNNYATAKMFEPLRDFLKAANKEKADAIAAGDTDSPAAKRPWVYSYALRGQTPIARGHSLDFFDFYRYADNAYFYETSSRDARIWQWDSYLCDIGRTLRESEGLELGCLIKPHRGAVIQRALAAAARGFGMLYWYTYGPDYAKGDSFSQRRDALELTSKAAHLIAKSEDALYKAEWVEEPEVALVTPFLLNGILQGELIKRKNLDPFLCAVWEDMKWTYLALAQAHIPVKAVNERFLVEGDLSKLKVIYLPSHALPVAAARKLEEWVKAGGTLYTNAMGLSENEAISPLETLVPVLGLNKRNKPEMWSNTPLYSGGQIGEVIVGDVAAVPEKADVILASGGKEPVKLSIGREVLDPAQGAEVLAKFADGGAAMTRFAYGKGQVYVAGFFPALEYSMPLRNSDYNMGADPDSALRELIALPAWAAGVKPVVTCDAPQVEGLLVKNKENGDRSVTLINWGYEVAGKRVRLDKAGRKHVLGVIPEIIPQQNLEVKVRGAGAVREARSVQLDKPVPFRSEGEDLILTIPELREGDVIVLR